MRLRQIKIAALGFFILSATASKGQAVNLTPGQTQAIQSAEAEHNEAEAYEHWSFTAQSVGPAKAFSAHKPKPGELSTLGIEHVWGGKNSAPGFRKVTFWLDRKGGDEWIATPMLIGQSFPTMAALQTVPPPAPPFTMKFTKEEGTVLGWAIGLAFWGGIGFLGVRLIEQGRTKRQKITVTCPRCRTVNVMTAGACLNCNSLWTQFDRDSDPGIPLHVKCKTCRCNAPYFPECTSCEANLAVLAIQQLPSHKLGKF